MPQRPNMFYQYRNPAIGMGFNGLAAAMFPDAADPRMQSAAVENMAQARAADALAGYRGEQTRGERFANDVRATQPTSIAELLLGGGQLQDDPIRVNPDYQPAQTTDFANILTNPKAVQQGVSSPFMPNRTANDKLAEAIMWAANNKIPLDQMLKAAGISGYTQRAAGADPQSALGFAPFVGVSPNTQTSLSSAAQSQISARDAAEDLVKQGTINQTNLTREEMQQKGAGERNEATNRTNITREGMQQAGANARNKYSTLNRPVSVGTGTDVFLTPDMANALGVSTNQQGQRVLQGDTRVGANQTVVPGTAGGDTIQGPTKTGSGSNKGAKSVPNPASKRMEAKITEALKADGLTADANTLAGLMSAAGTEWQTSQNPDAAADNIIQRLRAGEAVNGVQVDKANRTIMGVSIPGTERKSINRAPGQPAAPANDPLAAARDAIARGAPRDAVIKRLKDNGIDPKGL